MTEYQKIENALIPLGWTPEQRNGDHMRFSKEGVTQFITVYRNITDKGRALQNAYAEIRRVEPRFPLGRQAHMLETGETEEKPVTPEGLPSWMIPGRTVRWTAPEAQDGSRLSDPHSVMNKEYIINGFTTEGKDARVELYDPEHEITFQTTPEELDRWETEECQRCHAIMPVNRLSRSLDGKVYCQDCVNRIVQENTLPGSAKPVETPKQSEKTDVLLEDIEGITGGTNSELTKKLQELAIEMKGYDNMTEEQRKDLMERTKPVIESLSKPVKKSLRKKFPRIMEYFDPPQEKSPATTPYEAWKQALNDLLDFNVTMNPSGYDKELERQLKKSFFNSTYTITPLRDPGDKRKTVARLITVTTAEWDTAHRFWTGTELLFRHFKKALPDLPLYILVHCAKADFHQYMADATQYTTREKLADALIFLENILPESERDGFIRARGNFALPHICDVHQEILRRMKEADTELGERCGIMIEPDTMEPDSDDFETAPPIYVVTLLLTEKEDSAAFKRLCAQFDKKHPIDAPIRIHIIDWHTKKTATREYNMPTGNAEPTGSAEAAEDYSGDGRLIMGIFEKNLRIATGEIGMNAYNKQYLTNALYTAAMTNGQVRNLFAAAIRLYREKTADAPEATIKWKELTGEDPAPAASPENVPSETTINKKQPSNQNTMPQNDILDQFNPNSDYPFLATVSTRDLLKELKARGVGFDNLTIIVRKSIDINEI